MSDQRLEVVTDLVTALPQASQQRPAPEVFRVQEVTLAGESRRAIVATQPSRLVFQQAIPANGWLRVTMGVSESVWTSPGSGVLFLVGISQGGRYEELVSITIDPESNPADRQWMPVLLDLSPWEGQTVDVVLNTRRAPNAGHDATHQALWGDAAVVAR